MVEEFEDRWILRLRGIPVVAASQTKERQGTVVTLSGGAEFAFAGPSLLTDGPATAPGAVPLPAEDLSKLLGATVVSAVAFKSGLLRVVFSTGHHLNVREVGPETVVQVRNPGDFEWSYRGGVGVMKRLDSTSR